MLPVTSISAIALAALFAALALNVVRVRGRTGVVLGPGEGDLLRAVRAHGNLAECAPMVLVLLALCELDGAPRAWLALVAGVFVAGRLAHAFSLLAHEGRTGRLTFRVAGMAATAFALAALALTLATLLVAR